MLIFVERAEQWILTPFKPEIRRLFKKKMGNQVKHKIFKIGNHDPVIWE